MTGAGGGGGAEGLTMGLWEKKEVTSICGGEGRLLVFHNAKLGQDQLEQE